MAEPVPQKQKLQGYDFYREVLKSPKLVVAPMVDQSEYAWRILSRRYGAQLCYTPMFHARLFAEKAQYRAEQWQTGPGDGPLIVQFCANDAEYLLAAAKHVENQCDAVDINLGCPQHIARRGRYGAYLMEEWELISKMVRTLHENLAVPVTCKIRVFPEVEKTLKYAKMLEEAGCQLLTVHGRLREQKGHKTGMADWEIIRKVKESVSIPVFANGNILYHEDVQRCIDATGVDGVMTAEGNLYNPALFSGKHLPSWQIAEEYLEICNTIPNSSTFSAIRAHLFKIFRPCLADYPDIRTELSKVNTMQGFSTIVAKLKAHLLEASGGAIEINPPYLLDENGFRILPKWVLQPYFRVDGTLKGKKDGEEGESRPATPSTAVMSEGALQCTADGCVVGGGEAEGRADGSEVEAVEHVGAGGEVQEECGAVEERKERKAEKKERKEKKREREGEVAEDGGKKARKVRNGKASVCLSCPNVASPKCPLELCRQCCKHKGRDMAKQKGFLELGEGVPEESREWKKFGFLCEAHRTWK
ncbi:hypothetical protein HK097_002346, partial [Rhizophlyctis rosea]